LIPRIDRNDHALNKPGFAGLFFFHDRMSRACIAAHILELRALAIDGPRLTGRTDQCATAGEHLTRS
jgi:hypothetical protein